MTWRYAAALGGAGTLALALFWLMQALIAAPEPVLRSLPDYQLVEFVRLKRDPEPQVRKRTPPKEPPAEKEPPPPLVVAPVRRPRVTSPAIAAPRLDLPMDLDLSGLLDGVAVAPSLPAAGIASENEIIPLVRFPPRYPLRASRRGVEGWVRVEFTVTEEGRVEDAEVVEAEPPDVFDRAALEAIRKWRCEPRRVDGSNVSRRAVQRLEFKLEG